MLNNLQARLAPYLDLLGGNPWLQAATVAIVSLILALILDRIVSGTLRRLAARTRVGFDDYVIDALHGPLRTSIVLLGLALATNLLKLQQHFEFIIFSALLSVAYVVWMLFLLRVLRALLAFLSRDERKFSILHPQTLPLFDNLAIIAVVAIAVYMVFSAWGVDMTAWLASAGIIGIAVGFAAKDTLANLFSGVFILADAPYKIGDYVVLDSGERGEITHIGIRSTRLRTRDDVEVTVPNAIMGNTKIINESGGPYEKYRIRVKIGVAYGSDIDQVESILLDEANANELVCAEPEARVRFRAFGASSLDFELLCWVNQPAQRGLATHHLLGAIYKRFNAENIEIPYSKHDLYIKQMPARND